VTGGGRGKGSELNGSDSDVRGANTGLTNMVLMVGLDLISFM